MKMRIRGNSIRLRLGRSEVRMLLESGSVEESTTFDPFGRQRLIYAVTSSSDASVVTAAFEDGRVLVTIPKDLAVSWCTSDGVSITASQATIDGGTLRILIEKDLECLDAPVEESQADAYPRASRENACS